MLIQLRLRHTVSLTGEVIHAEASGQPNVMKLWPELQRVEWLASASHWMGPIGSAQAQPYRAVGVRPRALQEAQRDRAAVPPPQGLPQNLLSLRETRRTLLGFLNFALIIEALRLV